MAHEDEAAALIEMLEITENGIDRILHSEPSVFLLRFRHAMAIAPWQETKISILRARERLAEPDFDWKYVEGVGLVGESLKWKRDLLKTEALAGQGTIGRFLKLTNSFLGSLAKAIPLLEPVKEFKENVEACIRYLSRKMP